MKYLLRDRRESVELSVEVETAAGGHTTITGTFPVSKRILELTDAQVDLYGPALDELLAEDVLLLPKE